MKAIKPLGLVTALALTPSHATNNHLESREKAPGPCRPSYP
jgi:hypothetical protein